LGVPGPGGGGVDVQAKKIGQDRRGEFGGKG
jgi:hypothetical protein